MQRRPACIAPGMTTATRVLPGLLPCMRLWLGRLLGGRQAEEVIARCQQTVQLQRRWPALGHLSLQGGRQLESGPPSLCILPSSR